MPDESSTGPDAYATWRGTTLGRITEQLEVDLVFELAGPLEGKRVLDVGTGDGTYAIAAAERGARVVGVDTSRQMLVATESRAQERGVKLDLREGNVEQLPFEASSFDAVIAVTVLCFVSNPRLAVAEMARVLAPGGRLVLADLHAASSWAVRRRIKRWLGSSAWMGVQFWTKGELVGLAASAGLVVEHVRGAIHYPPLAVAARMLRSVDVALGKLRSPGAAFLAVSARKS